MAGEEVTEKEEQERKAKLPKTINLPALQRARIDEGIYGEYGNEIICYHSLREAAEIVD